MSTLTDSDAAIFVRAVQRVAPLGEDELRAALELCTLRMLKRGEYLLRAGDPAESTAVVASGLIREFFVMTDGEERTKAFVQAGEITGSLADLLASGASLSNIVAEQASRLVVISFSNYRGLIERFSGWARHYQRGLELLYLIKAQREFELLGLNAEQRYGRFAERYPGLEARVAARHVATYLGITPVHLSRLRRRRRDASQDRRS